MGVTQVSLISVYFLLSGLILVYGSSDDPDDFRKMTASIRRKCIAETKAPLEVIQDTEYGLFPDDDRLKCYFKCALEKSNLMDRKGGIKYDFLKKLIPGPYKELGNDMIDSCTHVDAEDKCEKAFNFMKCLFEANPIAFIAP
ncbi:odorant binding protein 11 [Xylocopa sonorina]|uniref:odorant binding protein 11 n=1 Tax=Xylocopa sonorina TaxID=1818115 RepID=UPI00403B0E3A